MYNNAYINNVDVDYLFKNSTEKRMSFEQIFQKISNFMKQDQMGNYRLMIGTDSQVQKRKKRTVFVTGIVIQRVGKGVWGCIRSQIIPRRMHSLKERISHETYLTEEMAYIFTDNLKSELIDIILPNIYKGSAFTMEGHMDIGLGKWNKTKEYADEMEERIKACGLIPVFKPYSFVASAYADKFTKYKII
jgi:predicted RNase H-related nuclease YkuK (DUF458 family)